MVRRSQLTEGASVHPGRALAGLAPDGGPAIQSDLNQTNMEPWVFKLRLGLPSPPPSLLPNLILLKSCSNPFTHPVQIRKRETENEAGGEQA